MPDCAIPPLPDDPAAALAVLASLADPDVVTGVLAARPPMPAQEWAELATLVRLGLLAVELTDRGQTTRSTSSVVRHVRYCVARGVDLSVTGMWASATVEHTLTIVAVGPAPSHAPVMAAPLRRVSRLLVPADQPPELFSARRKPTLVPYSSAELAGYVEHVTTLGIAMWRARASLAVALCAGAGLLDADLCALSVSSLVVTDTAVLVTVPAGPRGRTVAVQHGLEDLALAAFRFLVQADPRMGRPQAPLLPGPHPCSMLWRSIAWPTGMPAPTARRLRATWSALVLASGCGLPAYLNAANITDVAPWYGVVPHLEPLPAGDYYTQLRGSSAPVAEKPPALDGTPWSSPRVPLRTDDDGSTR